MNDAMMIVPTGPFTPDLSRRVRDRALRTANERDVVISIQFARNFSWSALCDLADDLRRATPHRIRLAGAAPAARTLLRELGIDARWFVDAADVRPGSRIVIA